MCAKLDNLDEATTVDEFFALNKRCTDIFGGGRPAYYSLDLLHYVVNSVPNYQCANNHNQRCKSGIIIESILMTIKSDCTVYIMQGCSLGLDVSVSRRNVKRLGLVKMWEGLGLVSD